jgi:hypothetical protein
MLEQSISNNLYSYDAIYQNINEDAFNRKSIQTQS